MAFQNVSEADLRSDPVPERQGWSSTHYIGHPPSGGHSTSPALTYSLTPSRGVHFGPWCRDPTKVGRSDQERKQVGPRRAVNGPGFGSGSRRFGRAWRISILLTELPLTNTVETERRQWPLP